MVYEKINLEEIFVNLPKTDRTAVAHVFLPEVYEEIGVNKVFSMRRTVSGRCVCIPFTERGRADRTAFSGSRHSCGKSRIQLRAGGRSFSDAASAGVCSDCDGAPERRTVAH